MECARLVFTYVLVPDFGVFADVIGHELDAFRRGEIVNLDAVVAEPVDASLKSLAFADDDGPEAKLTDQSRAVPAGGEGGDHDEVAIGALAAGVAEGVGFTVGRGVAVLDAAIVARAEESAIASEDGGPNGDASFGETEAGFRDGDGKHGVGIHKNRV